MTQMASLAADPPRGAISNLETGEVLRFQFNPTELAEDISVNYARLAPLGLSYQVLHYIGTNNQTFPIELYMSDIAAAFQSGGAMQGPPAAAALAAAGGVASMVAGPPAPNRSGLDLASPFLSGVMDAKHFLQSLAYPVERPGGGTDEPASVLFVWPSVVRMKCKVTSLAFAHRRFSIETLATTVLVATLTLEECTVLNVTADKVRRFGSRRD